MIEVKRFEPKYDLTIIENIANMRYDYDGKWNNKNHHLYTWYMFGALCEMIRLNRLPKEYVTMTLRDSRRAINTVERERRWSNIESYDVFMLGVMDAWNGRIITK